MFLQIINQPIGASAQLAGTIRLTYSLTAIILEATGNLTYSFPVFVTVFIAKIVGDFINEGNYENHNLEVKVIR